VADYIYKVSKSYGRIFIWIGMDDLKYEMEMV